MVDLNSMSAAEARLLLAKLSDQQRTVLLLGAQGYTSKEIARKLDIAPVTVDQRFARARLKLGGKDRRDTARIYAAVAAAAGYGPAIYGPSNVAAPHEPDAPSDLSRQSERVVADSEWEESGDQARFFVEFDPGPEQRPNLPFPSKGRLRNELSLKQRLFWIAVISLLGMLALRTAIETMKDLGSF